MAAVPEPRVRNEMRLKELLKHYNRLSDNEKRHFDKGIKELFFNAQPFFPNPSRDRRYTAVFQFLANKGYVRSVLPEIEIARKDLNVSSFLWACENADFRLYQILPAVLLRFPGHLKMEKASIPEDLRAVMEPLKADEKNGPTYHDFPFELLRSWYQFQPSDRRSRRAHGSRLSVRLDPEATRKLSEYCELTKITRSEAIHLAVRKLGV